MADEDLPTHPGAAAGLGVNTTHWQAQEIRLRADILAHCAWIASFDRDYAKDTYRNYARQLPWLELTKK